MIRRLAVMTVMLMCASGGARALDCIDYGDYLHAVPGLTAAWELKGIAGAGHLAYAVSSEGELVVYDMAVPTAPVVLATRPIPADADDCLLDGDRLYVAAGTTGVMVFDVAKPTNPVLVGTVATGGEAITLVRQHNFLFVACGTSGVVVMQRSARGLPRVRGVCDTPGTAKAIDLMGDIAYVADGAGGLLVVDVADRDTPVIVRMISQPVDTRAVAHEGTCLYVGNRDFLIRVYDITEPAAPRFTANQNIDSWPLELEVHDGILYAVSFYYVNIYEPNPSGYPTQKGRLYLGGGARMADLGGLMVASTGDHRLWTFDPGRRQPAAPVGQVDFSDLNGYAYGTCRVGNRLFISRLAGTVTVVDIADPLAPRLVTQMPVPGQCYDVAVEGNYAYVAAGPAGLVVVDITDIMHPKTVATIPTPTWVYNVALTPGYAHVAVSGSGYWIVDISDPAHPTVASRMILRPSVNRITIQGDYAYVTCLGGGLRVVDVRNPRVPLPVGIFPVSAKSGQVVVHGKWAFIDDDWVGVRSVDISNPTAPVGGDLLPLRCTVTAMYLEGNILYVGTTWEGLLVIDVSDPAHMKRIGLCPLAGGGDMISEIVGDGRAIYEIRSFQWRSVRTWLRQCDDAGGAVVARIDIEPKDPRNSVSCDAHDQGVIEVALLATPDVDPRLVEPQSLRFGPGSAVPLRGRQLQDVDGDHDEDLILRFHAADAGIQCTDASAELGGNFIDGRPFVGRDMVAPRAPGAGTPDVDVGLGATPNPFNPTTKLSFALRASGRATLRVYDLAGREVCTLVDADLAAGTHVANWDGKGYAGRPVASGIYVARLQADGGESMVRLALLK